MVDALSGDDSHAESKNPYTGDDVRQLWEYAKKIGIKGELQQLHARAPFTALLALAIDWCWIFLAFFAVRSFGLLLLPAALVVIGSRQRALVVLTHDAAHYALHPNRKVNDAVANLLLCLPMFLTLDRFRSLHGSHHRYLGDPRQDTDYLHSEDDMRLGWIRIYLKQVASWRNWLSSGLFGMFPSVSWSWKAAILSWWLVFSSALFFSLGWKPALLFLVLWILARAFVHHAIISFVIISDHVGLHPGSSILNFARNHCGKGLPSWIIHPHDNGYHLTHHLLPGLPFFALPRAHILLLRWPSYAAAAHCDAYFFGTNSAVHSWCGGLIPPLPLAEES